MLQADDFNSPDLASVPLLEPESPFFSAAGRGEALEQLLHFLRFTQTVLLVTGPEGSGRSTLRQQLLLQMPEWFVFQLEGSRVDAVQALESFLGQIGLRPQQPGLLLIDDAHLLDDLALNKALSAQEGNEESGNGMHLLLLGDESLGARVAAFDGDKGLLHQINLQPLTAPEVADYVELILEASGLHHGLSLTDGEIDELWQKSGGLPGNLNDLIRARVVDRLEEGPAATTAASPGLPVIHMVLLVVLVTGLVMAFFYRGSWMSPAPEVGMLPEPAELMGKAAVASGARPAPAAEEPARSMPEPEAEPTKTPVAIKPLVPQVTGVAEKAGLSELDSSGSDTDPAPLVQNVQQPRESEAGNIAVPRDQVTGKEPVGVEGKTIGTNLVREPEDDPLSALILSELTHAEAYLLSLPEDAYVLQVLSAVSKSAVEEFVARQENRDELYIYTAKRSGKDWHIVVTEGYDSLPEAKSHLRLLPAAQKKLGPWPRPVTAIQHSIREYRDI